MESVARLSRHSTALFTIWAALALFVSVSQRSDRLMPSAELYNQEKMREHMVREIPFRRRRADLEADVSQQHPDCNECACRRRIGVCAKEACSVCISVFVAALRVAMGCTANRSIP